MTVPRLRAFLPGTIAALLAGAAVSSAPDPPPFLVNESRSVPRGLYRRAPTAVPQPGRLVALRPPAAARSYLDALGVPSGMRLLKRVAAADGDRVCASSGILRTSGRTLPVPVRDRQGRPLPAWRGCRTLAGDELLLLGDTPDSFDGRHFGPVRRAATDGVYVEVLRW